MRVLKIIHTPGHGGAENCFRLLAAGLRQAGVEVIAAIPAVSDPQAENWIAPALSELGVPFLYFDVSGSPWQLLKNLCDVVDQVQPDIVHSHLLDSNFYSSLVCRWRSIPHISTEHGDVALRHSASSWIKYGAISLCSRFIVCVSGAVQNKAARRMLTKGKLRTIYNGIQFMEKQDSSFRDEFGVPADAVLIGNVGNLYPVKGHRFLLRAFAKIHTSCPEAHLVFVGRGSEMDSLRRLVQELSLPQDRVLFAGFRNDVENMLNALDLYVQPSLSEGHPLAVLEAMSLGVPVIATSVGGIPEITMGDRYGDLVPAGDVNKLAAKIQNYIDDGVRYDKKAECARDFVRREFSIQKMVNNYIRCYREILGVPESEIWALTQAS